MLTPKTITHAQRREVLSFLADCRTEGIIPEWACLTVADARSHGVRQLRRARGLIAIAFEPMLGNYFVLTDDLRRLNVTPEDAKILDRA